MQERRLFKRQKIECVVSLCCSKEEEILEAKALDISPLGIGLITQQVPLNQGSLVEVVLKDNHEEDILLRGKVIWYNEIVRGIIRVGIELDAPEIFKLIHILKRYQVLENK